MGEDATVERKLAFLLEQAERTQTRLNDLTRELADLPKTWRADVAAARGELLAVVDAKLEAERNAYVRSRLIGIVLLSIGVPIVFVANFI